MLSCTSIIIFIIILTRLFVRLYYEVFQQTYGAPSGEKMLVDVENYITRYNEKCGEECARMKIVNDSTSKADIIIAVCSPFMKRVHKAVHQSGELVFVDASGGVDRFNCRIFLLLTHSCAGGLPLGCFITRSESEDAITAGLMLLKSILPPYAFFHRGDNGPQAFLTDDCTAERQALRACYRESTLLLCIFHLLQAMWRYLWDAQNNIAKCDRSHLLGFLKDMVYCKTEVELEASYALAQADPVTQKYGSYCTHLQNVYKRRKEWAICYRDELPVRNNNTNNYVEAAMRVLKDKVFYRCKAFNIVQLLDFLVTRFDQYYTTRLIDIANNRLDMALSKRFIPYKNSVNPDSITRISDNTFTVVSSSAEGTEYCVDTVLGRCTCYKGRNGAPCKHQYAIIQKFKINSFNFVPISSPKLRTVLLFIATGKIETPKGWFESAPVFEIPVVDATTRTDVDTHIVSVENVAGTGDNHAAVEGEHDSEWNEVEELMSKIRSFAESLCTSLATDPETLLIPVKKFVKNADSLTSHSAMSSALVTFGKYSGAAPLRKKNSNPRPRGLQFMPRGAMIGVQPAAVARRKFAVGGRRSMISGRPCKDSVPLKRRANSDAMPQLLPVKKPKKAPHSLARCVESNVSLGKTHSTK